MWSKPIADITADDIFNLVESNVAESRHLEFKRQAPNNADNEVGSFVEAVCAFANAGGGYIIYGIEEKKVGLDTERVLSLNPITGDADALVLRLSNTIRDKIEPRVIAVFRAIELSGSVQGMESPGFVLAVRVEASLRAPHAVRVNSAYKFVVRVSAGKQTMEMSEIRHAMIANENASVRIETLLKERYEIRRQQGDLRDGGCILNLIPLIGSKDEDVVMKFERDDLVKKFEPICTSGWDSRFNVEGFCNYDAVVSDWSRMSKTQLYRDGSIEATISRLVHDNKFAGTWMVNELTSGISKYANALDGVTNLFPLVVSVAFYLNVGTILELRGFGERLGISSEDVRIPHIVLHEPPTNWHIALAPIFHVLWNAFGVSRCTLYDKEGKWIGT